MSDALAVLTANLRASAQNDARRAALRAKPANSMTVVLDGMEIPIVSGKCSRSIDTVADGWSAEMDWFPRKYPEIDRRVRYKSYAKAQLYLGTNLVNTGRLYRAKGHLEDNKWTKSLWGWSLTKDLVDSTIPPAAVLQGRGEWQYEWTGLSVWNYANAIIRPTGIGVRTDLSDAVYTEQFPYIQCEVTETYAEVITRLAFQRAMLVSNDEFGNLFLTAAKQKGAPVCTLFEGDGIVTTWDMDVDGAKLFYSYTVYGEAGDGSVVQSTAIDSSIPSSRTTAVRSGEAGLGNVQITAKWKRNRQLVDALTFPLPVSSWYAPNGSLWTPNTLVNVKSDTFETPQGFAFLIREVEYDYKASGCTAVLHLVPPLAYSHNEEASTGGLWQ